MKEKTDEVVLDKGQLKAVAHLKKAFELAQGIFQTEKPTANMVELALYVVWPQYASYDEDEDDDDEEYED